MYSGACLNRLLHIMERFRFASDSEEGRKLNGIDNQSVTLNTPVCRQYFLSEVGMGKLDI